MQSFLGVLTVFFFGLIITIVSLAPFAIIGFFIYAGMKHRKNEAGMTRTHQSTVHRYVPCGHCGTFVAGLNECPNCGAPPTHAH